MHEFCGKKLNKQATITIIFLVVKSYTVLQTILRKLFFRGCTVDSSYLSNLHSVCSFTEPVFLKDISA